MTDIMMDEQKNNTAQRIVLSREELLFVLQQLNATTLPGLDRDPLGELTPEGQQIALTVAERALQARGLVRRGQTNPATVHIHEKLLTAVGVCLYAQQAIFLYHRQAGQQRPTRYFGHLRENEVVAHTHPVTALHQFALLPSRDALFAELSAICACPVASPLQGEFALPFAVFEQIQQVSNGAATRLLTDANVEPSTADAFLTLLATDYRLSVLQIVNQRPDGNIAQQEMVLFHNDQVAWLAFAVKQPSGQTEMQMRTMNRNELAQLWSAWLPIPNHNR